MIEITIDERHARIAQLVDEYRSVPPDLLIMSALSRILEHVSGAPRQIEDSALIRALDGTVSDYLETKFLEQSARKRKSVRSVDNQNKPT
jgi:hypothetical protein